MREIPTPQELQVLSENAPLSKEAEELLEQILEYMIDGKTYLKTTMLLTDRDFDRLRKKFYDKGWDLYRRLESSSGAHYPDLAQTTYSWVALPSKGG